MAVTLPRYLLDVPSSVRFICGRLFYVFSVQQRAYLFSSCRCPVFWARVMAMCSKALGKRVRCYFSVANLRHTPRQPC